MNIFILITSNISKGPDRLLADVLVGGCDQANKGRNGPAWHDSGRLLGRPGGDVSQSPGCFELDRRTVHISQEGDKLGDETSADQLVNGRMFVTRQQLPVFKTVHKSYCASSYVAFIYGKRRKKRKRMISLMHSHYRAACVAWSWDSEFPLFTPATISSTVHCLSPCTGQQKAVYWTCKFKTGFCVAIFWHVSGLTMNITLNELQPIQKPNRWADQSQWYWSQQQYWYWLID